MGPRYRQGQPLQRADHSAPAAANSEGISRNSNKAARKQPSAHRRGSAVSDDALHVQASAASPLKKLSAKRRFSSPPSGGQQQEQRQQQRQHQRQQQQGQAHQSQHKVHRQQKQEGKEREQEMGDLQRQQQKGEMNFLRAVELKSKKKRRVAQQTSERLGQYNGTADRSVCDGRDAATGREEQHEAAGKQLLHRREAAATASVASARLVDSRLQQLPRRRDSGAAGAAAALDAAGKRGLGGPHQQQQRGAETTAATAAEEALAARKTAAATRRRGKEEPAAAAAGGAEQAEQAREEEDKGEGKLEQERGDTEEEENNAADPYLLAEAEYLRSESRWVNRQRVLVLSSRGVSFLQRRLMEDFKRLLPHHKAEAKWERKQTLRDIVEVAQLRACNNVLFFESRKHDFLLHVAKLPHGPTAIFRVLNIHTLGEMKMTGNCLLHSRPLLLFDPVFDSETQPHWRLLKELFIQVFGTPRNHPKAKPFFDHAMGFYKFDGNKIWFRHYQIAPLVPGSTGDANKPERQTFVEIGPRCVFEAVKILDDAFGGKTIWSNREYVPTRDVVALQRMHTATEYAARVTAKERREERKESMKACEDPLSFECVFGKDGDGNLRRPSKKQKSESAS